MGLQWRASVVRNPKLPVGVAQHGLTCKSTERARRQLRGDRLGYSRPARRDVPPAGVWCVPGWPVTTPRGMSLGTPESMFGLGSRGRSRVDLTPIGARNPSCSSV